MIKFLKNYKKYELFTPGDILDDMKKYYNKEDIPVLTNTLKNCLFVAIKSKDLKLVIDSLETGARKAYVLKQLEQIGSYRGFPSSDFYLNIFIGRKSRILNNKIKHLYQKIKFNIKYDKDKKHKLYTELLDEIYKYSTHYPFRTECYIEEIETKIRNIN